MQDTAPDVVSYERLLTELIQRCHDPMYVCEDEDYLADLIFNLDANIRQLRRTMRSPRCRNKIYHVFDQGQLT